MASSIFILTWSSTFCGMLWLCILFIFWIIFFVKHGTDNGLSLRPLFFRQRVDLFPRYLLSEKETVQGGAMSRRRVDAYEFLPEREKKGWILDVPKRKLPLRVTDYQHAYVVKAY
jgi:hypothetical protein